MKRFKFKLESVLTERKRAEDLKLKEWSIVSGMLQDLKNEKTKMEARLIESMKEKNAVLDSGKILAGFLTESEGFIHSLKLRIEWKTGEIIRAEKFVEKKRQEWLELRKKRAILDKLKELQLEQFQKDKRKKEDKDLDDLYIMRRRISEEDVA